MIKLSKADRLFSLYIRTRDEWKCQRCEGQYEPPTMQLHCSHFYGRIGKSTRWDEENAVALCYKCHQYFTDNPKEHRAFFLKRHGPSKYEKLVLRAHIPMKVDEKLMAEYWEEKLNADFKIAVGKK